MSDRIPNSPPSIAAISNQLNRPVWSVMIPSYNCSNYLREALISVLAQDPGPEVMQIEVVDDHSTDTDVEALVAEIGKGRVGFFRQENNVGSLRNFETCLNRSKGQWIHILHGDDMVKPGFYQEIASLFKAYPDAGAAFTGCFYIDAKGDILYTNDPLVSRPGLVKNWFSLIARSQQIQPPTMVVKRFVYEQLGGFFGFHYGEDWEMWVRISSRFPVVHSPRHLAKYRVHRGNITSRYFMTGQNIRDVASAIEIVQNYIPDNRRKRLKRMAKKHFAIYFAKTADMVYYDYANPRQALYQAREAFRMHQNLTTLYFVWKTYCKLLVRYKFHHLSKSSFLGEA
jgi:glycosyltransferase involved in cell wall biosynthesis